MFLFIFLLKKLKNIYVNTADSIIKCYTDLLLLKACKSKFTYLLKYCNLGG